MKKVVINDCYGGFGLSEQAMIMYRRLAGKKKVKLYDRDIQRDDPFLIQVVETLGRSADGYCARLKIVEIPEDVKFIIEEYDGAEWVAEEHRTWS